MKLLNLSTLLPPVPWEWPGQCRAFHLVFHFICRMIEGNARRDWLLQAHDLLEYMQIHGWHHGKTQFSLFCCNMAHRFEHVCLIISDLEGESKEKKFTTSYLQRRKMEKWRQKEFLTTLRMSINCKKSLQQLNCDHCVIAVRDLLFRKMFRTLFCFEQQKTSKTLRRSNCTQVRWRKKKKQRRQVYITWDLKNA